MNTLFMFGFWPEFRELFYRIDRETAVFWELLDQYDSKEMQAYLSMAYDALSKAKMVYLEICRMSKKSVGSKI